MKGASGGVKMTGRQSIAKNLHTMYVCYSLAHKTTQQGGISETPERQTQQQIIMGSCCAVCSLLAWSCCNCRQGHAYCRTSMVWCWRRISCHQKASTAASGSLHGSEGGIRCCRVYVSMPCCKVLLLEPKQCDNCFKFAAHLIHMLLQ